ICSFAAIGFLGQRSKYIRSYQDAGRYASARPLGMGPRRRFELHRYSRHGGGLSGRHRHPARGDRIPHAAPSSAGPAEGDSPGAHVEVDRYEPPVVSDAQARDFAATLAALRENLPGEFLQIDFEAKSSQRDFFVKAVAALRQRLPDAVLSATALTSW